MHRTVQAYLRDIVVPDHQTKVKFQITKLKCISKYSESHTCFGFPVLTKVMFTLYCSLLSMQ